MKLLILEILRSSIFKDRLIKINRNYPNLKQENHIRNSLLELINEHFENSDPQFRAFAEHPRERSLKVDLSIVNKVFKEKRFSIEIKFQYTNDYKQFIDYSKFIDNDFQRVVYGKQADMFILVISHWERYEKCKYDTEWGITTNLSRYLSNENTWKNNVNSLWYKYKEIQLNELLITVNEPYPTHYNFYIISRN